MRVRAMAVILAGLSLLATVRAAPRKPNVMFILADDLGWMDTGCYGSTFYETPNIDRLAARGVRYTQAYAANPLCSPTRASILTGLSPARLGITYAVCHLEEQLEKRLDPGTPNVRVLNADSLTRFDPKCFTLAEAFKEDGYATAHFGKWHVGWGSGHEPKDRGSDLEFPHAPRACGPAGGYLAPWRFIPGGLGGNPGQHIDDRMAEEAATFIREHKKRPFFLNFWLYSVHAPFNARQDYIDHFKAKVDPDSPRRNPLYAAMVKSLDDSVGRLLKAVDDAGVADNTIIVFTSDNGGFVARPKETDPAGHENAPITSSHPLRRGKGSLYEGGTRVPCIIVWPDVSRPGTTSDALLQSTDFYPTLLAMCGLKPRDGQGSDGFDQSATVKGRPSRRDRVFCHYPHGGQNRVGLAHSREVGFIPGTYIRKGDWKLIRFYADNPDGTDRLELFNLREDIGEKNDLAAIHPERASELNRLVGEFLQDTQAVVPKLNPAFKPLLRPAGGRGLPYSVRGGKAGLKDGILVFERESAIPFLGLVTGRLGEGAEFRARINSRGGPGSIAWFPAPIKTTGNPPPVPLAFAGGWQELHAEIPAKPGQNGVLRFHLPVQDEPVQVDWIEIKDGTSTRRWGFDPTP